MQQNYNKKNKNVAQLGHGKWKSALGRTLLLIGMVLVSMGAFAQVPTGGLYLYKTWIPDETDPTGGTGEIMLETFVTGEKTIIQKDIPSDIVLVLDVSTSMSATRGTQNTPSDRALTYNKVADARTAETNYTYSGYQVFAEEYNNRYYVYYQRGGTKYYFTSTGGTNTSRNRAAYSSTRDGVIATVTSNNLHQGSSRIFELKKAVAGFVETVNIKDQKEDGTRIGNKLSIITYSTDAVMHQELEAIGDIVIEELQEVVWGFTLSSGTRPSFGINLANDQFDDNPHANETIGEDFTRTVVMFTDGEPYDSPKYGAVSSALTSKQTYNATVYSIGMFTTSPAQTSNTWKFMNYVSSNYPNAYLDGNGEDPEDMHPGDDYNPNLGFYIDASNDEMDLSDIFQHIAEASGGSFFNLGSTTVVQDVISPSFQLVLPEGVSAGTVIRAYAPKCNGKDGDAFKFEDTITGATRMTLNTNGVVVGNDENRLANNIVQYNAGTKTLTFSGFNFNAMYVAQELDDEGHPVLDDDDNPIFSGRKLQMFIPLEIIDGAWGDGISTNGPMSVIYPNNNLQTPIYFNNPTTNVLGSVWTEVVTTKPSSFKVKKDSDGSIVTNIDEVGNGDGEGLTAEIGTPEDLAWFISEVNGRIGYNVVSGVNTNIVASHPKLNGRLTADIDMSAHNWVPIGAGYVCNSNNQYLDATGTVTTDPDEYVKLSYQGTFDGNGHVVTGLKNNADKFYKLIQGSINPGVVVFPGMFCNVTGTVKNVFVLDADFRGKHHNDHFVHHGIIADTLSEGGLIFNCEAAGRITCNNDNVSDDIQLIYGGLVGLNEGTVHSSMAMAELTAYTMGGMIGENRGSFSNGFTNGVYNYLNNGVTGKYTGGIAAKNSGSIDNCYVRFERPNTNLTYTASTFGMIYGINEDGGTATNCYTPQIVTWSRPSVTSVTTKINTNTTVPNTFTEPAENPTNSYTLTMSPSFYNMFSNDNMTGGSWVTLGSLNVYKNGTPLLDKLNDYVDNYDGDEQLSSWKRTTAGNYSDGAGNINGDFPVLQFDSFGNETVTCLGSADGIRIDYATSLIDMLHRHNNGNFNENTALVGGKYKPTNHAAIYKGTINLYANDDVTLEQPQPGGKEGETVADNRTAEGVVVYIDENISLLQDASSSIEAYTGQTLKAFKNTDIQAGDRWHNISSSLSNSQFGWSHLDTDRVPSALSDGWDAWANTHTYTDSQGNVKPRDSKDPCLWNLNNHDEDQAFFPIDLSSYHRAEFYCFYEPQYHWLNFRRNKLSHWHMDDPELNIPYNEQEDQFIPGKGYLASVDMSYYWDFNSGGVQASKKAQFMQNRGTLNNGTITIPVTYTAANEWTGLAGYNLLGNPYQSYLDFTTFAWANSSLWNAASEMTFAIYDPETGNYVQGVAGAQPSEGSMATTGDINMHQGFFIRVSKGGTATFNNGMRFNTPANGTHFRGERLNYPVINLIATDSEGNNDVAVLEVGRPENGGGEKLRVGSATGRISLRHDDTDFGILFSDMTEGSQPLRFETEEDGTFTLSWNTANANFSSLTLVDNITGVHYDMLAHDSYEFEGRASDYKSRFKILIGEFTDVEENEETVTNNFAFFDGSEWVVNGKGQLTVTDVMGRMVYTDNLTNDQNHVSLNGLSQGVYLMQVRNGNGAMVQKIVVR